jgi:hypothetical protein
VDRFANRVFLASVMVEPNASARAIVAFEDSIADGTNLTVNANSRWPEVLARPTFCLFAKSGSDFRRYPMSAKNRSVKHFELSKRSKFTQRQLRIEHYTNCLPL